MPLNDNWDTWIGINERCDDCRSEYPMSWVEFNGQQFLCLACRTDHQLRLTSQPMRFSNSSEPPLTFEQWCHEADIERCYQLLSDERGDAVVSLAAYKEQRYSSYLERHSLALPNRDVSLVE